MAFIRLRAARLVLSGLRLELAEAAEGVHFGQAGGVTVRSTPHVRRAGAEDLDEVAGVLADAFSDYPWTRWTIDARDHRERIKGLQRLVLENVGLPYGQVWIVSVGVTIEAAAIWMDTRTPPPERLWSDMASEQSALEGDRADASRAAEAAVAHLRPELPHLYLGAVGARARSQRRGLGAAVLAPALAAADDQRMHAFLETSSDANLGFYGRLGFEVVDTVQIEEGPPVWAMLREPAAAEPTPVNPSRRVQ